MLQESAIPTTPVCVNKGSTVRLVQTPAHLTVRIHFAILVAVASLVRSVPRAPASLFLVPRVSTVRTTVVFRPVSATQATSAPMDPSCLPQSTSGMISTTRLPVFALPVPIALQARRLHTRVQPGTTPTPQAILTSQTVASARQVSTVPSPASSYSLHVKRVISAQKAQGTHWRTPAHLAIIVLLERLQNSTVLTVPTNL